MAQTVSNVVAANPVTTGGVLLADSGTTLPTDTDSELDAAFKALGYAGDDGLVFTPDRSTDKVKAWGGDIVKVLQTDFSASFQFTLIEVLNQDALKAAFGDSAVTNTAATTTSGTLNSVKINGDRLPHKVWVFDMIDGVAKARMVVPDGQVTAVSNITFSSGGIAGLQLTVEAFEDSNGNNVYMYTDDGIKSAT